MAQRKYKTVLFLCTGNYYRSRFAEILFNAVAARLGLPWRAASRGLALERGVNNVGPLARSALQEVQRQGIRDDSVTRLPLPAASADFAAADWVVAVQESEHLPLLQERFPDHLAGVEFWEVADDPEALGLIEREVLELTVRLLSGRKRTGPPPPVESPVEQPSAKVPSVAAKSVRKGAVVRVGRETKGRRGKGVTIVSDVPLDEAGLLELAAMLKQKCGTGGTVAEGRIEIQGDQRERLVVLLQDLGYQVKRVGG